MGLKKLLFLESKQKANEYIMEKVEEAEFSKDYYYLAFYLKGKDESDFLELQKLVKEEDLYTEETFGREDKPHCTVFYGLKENKHYEIREFMKTLPPAKLEYGEIISFRNKENEYDVIVVEIKEVNDSLTKVHNFIKETFDNDWTHESYTPHMTIAYVKSDKSKDIEGSNILEGKSFEINELTYIDRSRNEFSLLFGW